MLRKLFVFVICLMATVATASAQTPPDNEIWYTTTDGRTISFNDDNLVSHNYNNGRGVLKFKNSVTSIERLAFEDCSSLTSITIPNSVTSIGKGAFLDCSSLTSITIPNSVTSIEFGAFAGCSSLTSITIPESVTEIKDGAFSGCSSLPVIDNIRYADTYLIEAVDKSLTSYSIKEGTRFIGSWAFHGCSSLTSITIPNSVTSIEYEAFSGCSSLTSITIPESVKSIGYEAFKGCSSLTSITIPNSVTSIGWYAFDGCSSLTSITIGNSVTEIEGGAFSGCSSLTSITIPNSVTSIGDDAFLGCSSLTSITIPNSITSIGEWAFNRCTSLTSITIGNSVTSIGREAFKGCSSLKSVKVSNEYCYDYFKNLGVSDITFIVSTLEEYEEAQKLGATKLAIDSNNKYASEDGLCLIDNGKLILFIGKDLTEYTIPESVTSIEYGAFNGCNRLKSVKVANKDCYDYFKDKVVNITFYGANASDDGRCLILGGKLERFSAKGITEYTIPESVTSIGEGAFKDCSNLKSVKVANKDCYDYFKDKVANIAFYGANASADGRCLIIDGELKIFIAKGVTEYTILNSVTRIEDYAFRGCSSLTSITIPNSITSIEKGAFAICSSLTSITIPDSVTYIGEGVFYRCSSLTSITIPNSVTNIGKWAFYGCSSLTSITIPDSVTSIGEDAFAYCSSLKSVKVANEYCYDYFKDKIANIAFYGANASADGRCLIIDGKLKIFIAKGITEYTIPESVTSIGEVAFRSCSSLTSITIPNSVTNIGNDAFHGCDSLTSITCLATTPPAIDDLMIGETTMIYVPKEAIKAYKKDPNWSRYKKQIKRIK